MIGNPPLGSGCGMKSCPPGIMPGIPPGIVVEGIVVHGQPIPPGIDTGTPAAP
jgi:hypothetical protein